MIIAISGKIGSGKDTIGQIIQYLQIVNTFKNNNYINTSKSKINLSTLTYEKYISLDAPIYFEKQFLIKKFADTLKDIVCLLIGCTREQLEDHEFKNTELGKEWWYYKLRTGIGLGIGKGVFDLIPYLNHDLTGSDLDICNERYLIKLTPRLLLQIIGTECGRDIVHPNIWINSLFSKYKKHEGFGSFDPLKARNLSKGISHALHESMYPNWIITDLRFPNELQAIKDRQGISIRVNRYPTHIIKSTSATHHHKIPFDINIESHRKHYEGELQNQHESETALDNATFDYTIDNNGTIEDLIEKVKEILIKEQILKQ